MIVRAKLLLARARNLLASYGFSHLILTIIPGGRDCSMLILRIRKPRHREVSMPKVTQPASSGTGWASVQRWLKDLYELTTQLIKCQNHRGQGSASQYSSLAIIPKNSESEILIHLISSPHLSAAAGSLGSLPGPCLICLNVQLSAHILTFKKIERIRMILVSWRWLYELKSETLELALDLESCRSRQVPATSVWVFFMLWTGNLLPSQQQQGCSWCMDFVF